MSEVPLTIDINTLDELIALFVSHLDGKVLAGDCKPMNRDYYARQLRKWQATLPASIRLADLKAFHLTSGSPTWHRIQSVQRLFNWARRQQIIPYSPFTDVEKPPLGRRERVLSRPEARLLLRACDIRPTRQRTVRRLYRRVERPVSVAALAGAPVRPLRWFLMALGRMAARPGELRCLQWKHYRPDLRQFELKNFKAKARRRDGVRLRILLVDEVLARVLATWQRRRSPAPDDFVFLNGDAKPWTKNAISKGVRHACKRAGLDHNDAEPIVAYTQRHTAATRAANPLDGSPGASLVQIGAWLGHSNPQTTSRYVHLNTADMRAVALRAAAVARRNGSTFQSTADYQPPALQGHTAPQPLTAAPQAARPIDPAFDGILQVLREPRSIDELARQLIVPIGDLNKILLQMELKRLVRRLPGGRFERH